MADVVLAFIQMILISNGSPHTCNSLVESQKCKYKHCSICVHSPLMNYGWTKLQINSVCRQFKPGLPQYHCCNCNPLQIACVVHCRLSAVRHNVAICQSIHKDHQLGNGAFMVERGGKSDWLIKNLWNGPKLSHCRWKVFKISPHQTIYSCHIVSLNIYTSSINERQIFHIW